MGGGRAARGGEHASAALRCPQGGVQVALVRASWRSFGAEEEEVVGSCVALGGLRVVRATTGVPRGGALLPP